MSLRCSSEHWFQTKSIQQSFASYLLYAFKIHFIFHRFLCPIFGLYECGRYKRDHW